jgi:hypothetical protein
MGPLKFPGNHCILVASFIGRLVAGGMSVGTSGSLSLGSGGVIRHPSVSRCVILGRNCGVAWKVLGIGYFMLWGRVKALRGGKRTEF